MKLVIFKQFYAAIKNDDVKKLMELIENVVPFDSNSSNSIIIDSPALLNFAILNQRYEILKILINNLPIDNYIMSLCRLDCVEGVQTLVKCDADFIINEYIKNYSPLHYCAEFNSKQICEYLIKLNADVNKVNRYGMTALHLACLHSNIEIVKLLCTLTNGNIEINKCDIWHRNAFNIACGNSKNLNIVKYLLCNTSINYNLIDRSNDSAIANAARWNAHKIIKYLLSIKDENFKIHIDERNLHVHRYKIQFPHTFGLNEKINFSGQQN